MSTFNIPDFLRLIGKGPEQRPEWWRENYFVRDGCIPMCPREFICISPFTDILTAWTPDKDALLLGVCLECLYDIALTVHLNKNGCFVHTYGYQFFNAPFCIKGKLSEPGLTLARAIWAAKKEASHDAA